MEFERTSRFRNTFLGYMDCSEASLPLSDEIATARPFRSPVPTSSAFSTRCAAAVLAIAVMTLLVTPNGSLPALAAGTYDPATGNGTVTCSGGGLPRL